MTSPFGITLHQPLPHDVRLKDIGSDKYAIVPPSPHPSFIEYFAQESSKYGTVWLKGVSAEFANDAYGYGIAAQFERLSSQLSTRYGQPRCVDALHIGSIWEEARHWLASLYENERSFFHVWESKNLASLPEDIDTIFLGILATSHSDASIIIEYSAQRYNDAQKASDDDLANLF